MRALVARIAHKLESLVDRFWFVPLLAVLAAVDLFAPLVPTDVVIVACAAMRPTRWLKLALGPALGSALGSFALAWALGHFGGHWAASILEHPGHSKGHFIHSWVHQYGVLGIGLVSLSPLPQQPAVALGGLAGLSPFGIFLAVLGARSLKYSLFAWLAVRAPQVLEKLHLKAHSHKRPEPGLVEKPSAGPETIASQKKPA